MTYREKVIKEHPRDVGKQWSGGVKYCPFFYGYEEKLWCCNRANNSRSTCEECWNREIEEKENTTMKYKVGDTAWVQARIVDVCEHENENAYDVELPGDRTTYFKEYELFELPKQDKTYEQGLEDAWELANKVFDMDYNETVEVFDCDTCDVMKMKPQAALAKLKAYEDEHTIKVGDVVTFGMRTFVVTYADDEDVVGIEGDGYLIKINDTAINKIKKTGKRIDIAGMLEQIG